MIQAFLLAGAASFWILARVFQPMPPWAVPAMWVSVITLATAPYFLGLPTQVMEEAILPVCAGMAGGEWAAGRIIARRQKIQAIKAQARKKRRRRRPDQAR